MKIAIAGGDERMPVVAKRLAGDGFECRLLGFPNEKGLDPAIKRMENIGECFDGASAIILPMPAFKGGRLFAPKTEKSYGQDEILNQCGEKLVIGGILPFRDGTHIDYSADEPLLIKNAHATAEGALELIIRLLPVTVCGSRFVITGYGRIASRLARMIKSLGGRVHVIARSERAIAEAESDGLEAAGFGDIEAPLSRADALINTVPHRVFDLRTLAFLKKGSPYIELASSPGGADRAEVESLGLPFVPAPGLPGKTAPQTAGEIIYQSVASILRERRRLL